ncbi:hypothetical protein CDD83_9948 [Cordyceps sp. RAO-2017]|nr:hypothetical protein CDD83_9948 [Cordyceps sp. RAO-2017]
MCREHSSPDDGTELVGRQDPSAGPRQSAEERNQDEEAPWQPCQREGQDSATGASRRRESAAAESGAGDGEASSAPAVDPFDDEASSSAPSVDPCDDEASSSAPSVDAKLDEVRSSTAQEVSLFGFQGMTTFRANDTASFFDAVRRLLSLEASAEGEPFTLVHYHRGRGAIVEIEDAVWSAQRPPSYFPPALLYLTVHFLTERWYRDDSAHHPIWCFGSSLCCALFVKRPGEETPPLWRPSEAQLQADVACLELSQTPGGPQTMAYLAFPKDRGSERLPVGCWDQETYVPYVRTAVEVLTGRERLHCLGRFETAALPLTGIGQPSPATERLQFYLYGFRVMRPVILETLDPVVQRQGEASRASVVSVKGFTLDADFVFLMMPCYYNFSDGVVTVARARDFRAASPRSDGRASPPPPIVGLIRHLARSFLTAINAYDVSHVLVLAGPTALGPGPDLNAHPLRPSALIPLLGELPDGNDGKAALQRIANAQPGFVLVHPLYLRCKSSIQAGWLVDSRVCARLPDLGEPVATFRHEVAILCRDAGPPEVTYDPEKHDVGLRVVAVDAADGITLCVGPSTTDEQWYAIRAQITVPSVVATIYPAGSRDWRRGVADSNVWGPRYGRCAGILPPRRCSPRPEGHASSAGRRSSCAPTTGDLDSLFGLSPAEPSASGSRAAESGGEQHGAPIDTPASLHEQLAHSLFQAGSFARSSSPAVAETASWCRSAAMRMCPWCDLPWFDKYGDDGLSAHLRQIRAGSLVEVSRLRRATGRAYVDVACQTDEPQVVSPQQGRQSLPADDEQPPGPGAAKRQRPGSDGGQDAPPAARDPKRRKTAQPSSSSSPQAAAHRAQDGDGPAPEPPRKARTPLPSERGGRRKSSAGAAQTARQRGRDAAA